METNPYAHHTMPPSTFYAPKGYWHISDTNMAHERTKCPIRHYIKYAHMEAKHNMPMKPSIAACLLAAIGA